jgi:sodium-independent sulfate anion transporter 11
MEFLWNILGDIPSGFPPFKLPAFSFQNGDETYSFVEVCRNLGSSLYISPLVAVLESIAIAKSLGTNNQCEKCSFFKNQFLGLEQILQPKGKELMPAKR